MGSVMPQWELHPGNPAKNGVIEAWFHHGR
jgi:transposase InsO family protein